MFCVQSRQDGAQGTWRQAGRAPAQPPHTHTHFLGGDLGSPLSSPGLRLPTASTGLVHSLRGREFSLTVNWNGSSWSQRVSDFPKRQDLVRKKPSGGLVYSTGSGVPPRRCGHGDLNAAQKARAPHLPGDVGVVIFGAQLAIPSLLGGREEGTHPRLLGISLVASGWQHAFRAERSFLCSPHQICCFPF